MRPIGVGVKDCETLDIALCKPAVVEDWLEGDVFGNEPAAKVPTTLGLITVPIDAMAAFELATDETEDMARAVLSADFGSTGDRCEARGADSSGRNTYMSLLFEAGQGF